MLELLSLTWFHLNISNTYDYQILYVITKNRRHPKLLGYRPLAESVRFELTVGRPITSFQDWLLKPLGQLSMCVKYIIESLKSQGGEG